MAFCLLRFREEDCAALADLVPVLHDVLTGTHLERVLARLAIALPADARAVAVATQAASDENSLCTTARDASLALLRVLASSQLDTDTMSHVTALAAALLSRSLQPQQEVQDEIPAAAPSSSESALIPASTFLPLCQVGNRAAGGWGFTAPHVVDLKRQGFSLGWRMYVPRDDQKVALASGVQTGASSNAGLLFSKGKVPAGGRAVTEHSFGVRLTPSLNVQFFVAQPEVTPTTVTLTSPAPVIVGKWVDVVVTLGSDMPVDPSPVLPLVEVAPAPAAAAPLKFKLNRANVPSGGLRIRRHANISSDLVGSLKDFDAVYTFSRIEGDWAKLAPETYPRCSLEHSLGYVAHDTSVEGWCAFRLSGNDSFVPFVIAPPASSTM